MVKRTFSCDLCEDSYQPESFDKELFGVYFDTNHSFVLKNPTQTEHHLCRHCLVSAGKCFHEQVATKERKVSNRGD